MISTGAFLTNFMMFGLRQTTGLLFFPGAVIFAALLGLPRVIDPEQLSDMTLRLIPCAALAFALLLSWRFNRSRATLSMIVLALMLAHFQFNLAQTTWLDDATNLPPLLEVCIATALFVIATLRDQSFFSLRGGAQWILLAAPSATLAVLWHTWPTATNKILDASLINPAWVQWSPFNQLTLLILVLTAGLYLCRLLVTRSSYESGLLASSACILLMLVGPQSIHTLTAWATSAALIIAIALIQDSYRMAYIDELSGLPGRRALNQTLRRLGRRYTVAMIDVDHFKRFNDRYGHDVGDQVLRMVAAHLRRVGGNGKAFRYGGEEFTIVFANRHPDDIRAHLETLRQTIAESRFNVRKPQHRTKTARLKRLRSPASKKVAVTVSIGMAERNPANRYSDEVIKAADKALYRAKKRGRNRLCS
jgi:diguanylate cyclase (GGDEF)-like protein